VNLSSGGLAIVAIAAIWFLVFLPSFIKGEKNVVREVVVAPRIDERSIQLIRARRARAIFATVAAAGFVVAGLSALQVVSSGQGIALAISSVAVTLASTFFTIRSHRGYQGLLAGSVKRTIPLTSSKPTQRRNLDEAPSRSWNPESVPQQNFLKTGAIEIVELAEVVEIEPAKIDNIDEILRRRRHIG
jgi:hypothetical protein